MDKKNNNKESLETGGLSIKINLVKEKMIDKKGKVVKNPAGDVSYIREDCTGLMSLLNKFNTTLHDMKDFKTFLKIKDKIYKIWTKDGDTMELSLDEASFLRTYLSEFKEKDGKNVPLREFELRTLVGILEALE